MTLNTKMHSIKIRLVTLFCLAIITQTVAQSSPQQDLSATDTNRVKVVGAMKNVMWKGELGGIVQFDTLAPKRGLYGLGPESFLTGEILIIDGTTYVSRVTSDTTMTVQPCADCAAPFFVYAHINNWRSMPLPQSISSIADLEKFIDEHTSNAQRPFAFKLVGTIKTATIHVQNLPRGTAVSSPTEAHQGQVNYDLKASEVTIIGFFSTAHQGIFTHHDSYLHMHLITANNDMMGHVDAFELAEMTLYLPED